MEGNQIICKTGLHYFVCTKSKPRKTPLHLTPIVNQQTSTFYSSQVTSHKSSKFGRGSRNLSFTVFENQLCLPLLCLETHWKDLNILLNILTRTTTPFFSSRAKVQQERKTQEQIKDMASPSPSSSSASSSSSPMYILLTSPVMLLMNHTANSHECIYTQSSKCTPSHIECNCSCCQWNHPCKAICTSSRT